MRNFISLCVCVVVWFGHVAFVEAGDKPGPDASPRPTKQKAAKESEPVQIIAQCLVVELRGETNEIKQGLRAAGFQETTAGCRYLVSADDQTKSGSEAVNSVLRKLSEHMQVQILSRPQIRTIAGQPAEVHVGTASNRIQYLVQVDENTFKRRELEIGPTPESPESSLGVFMGMTCQIGEDDKSIEISKLKLSVKTMDGREKIPGLELEVGKPIISTRTLETSMTVPEGTLVNGLVLSGPPGRQLIYFLSVRRLEDQEREGK